MRLGVAGFAFGLWLSAFAPTPAASITSRPRSPSFLSCWVRSKSTHVRHEAAARAAGILIVILATIATDGLRDPLKALASLRDPSQWPPVQLHEVAMELRDTWTADVC